MVDERIWVWKSECTYGFSGRGFRGVGGPVDSGEEVSPGFTACLKYVVF